MEISSFARQQRADNSRFLRKANHSWLPNISIIKRVVLLILTRQSKPKMQEPLRLLNEDCTRQKLSMKSKLWCRLQVQVISNANSNRKVRTIRVINLPIRLSKSIRQVLNKMRVIRVMIRLGQRPYKQVAQLPYHLSMRDLTTTHVKQDMVT